MNTKLYIIVALTVCLIFGCASQESLYKKARETNTVEAYEEYLQKYPDGEFAKEAKNNIAREKFNEAKRTNTVEAYEWFLENYSESAFDSLAKTKLISLEFVKSLQLNTLDGYKNFLKKYPKSIYDQKAKQIIVQLEYENTKKLNTLDAYKSFYETYKEELPLFYNSEIIVKIYELSYQKAIETNTIESLNQFIQEFPNCESVVKDRLFHLENKEIVDKILFSKNDNTRLVNFKSFIQKEFINKNYDVTNLSKLLRLLASKFSENPELLPLSGGGRNFFTYLADIDYFPTVRKNIEKNQLWENAVSILTPYQSLQKLYSVKHNYESAYLAHNIGRVACLIKAEKHQGQFFNVDFWDISSQSQRSVIDAFAQAFARSYKSSGVEGVLNDSQQGQNYSLKLIEIYKQSIIDLFSTLESPRTTSQTKIYILKRLGHWVELTNIENALINKLRYVAQNDPNAKVRTLASRAAKNAMEAK